MKLQTKSKLLTALVFVVSLTMLFLSATYLWLLPLMAFLFCATICLKNLNQVILAKLVSRDLKKRRANELG